MNHTKEETINNLKEAKVCNGPDGRKFFWLPTRRLGKNSMFKVKRKVRKQREMLMCKMLKLDGLEVR